MSALTQALAPAAIGLAFIGAIVPLTVWGARVARRHRGSAMLVGSLLLIFGVNVQVTPPPPPRIEVTEREAEKPGDDEPKDPANQPGDRSRRVGKHAALSKD